MKNISYTLLVFALILTACANPSALRSGAEAGEDNSGTVGQPAYQMISVEELDARMGEGDLFLVNVHIPLEGNIPGTDEAIPYNAVEDYLDQLPADKDQPVYLYCRSGSMGDSAAQSLVDLGYTHVFNLEGGYIAWRAAGLPFEE
jgi:rhodanese-related sulfurtransferase